ncbi:unnamed protein product [Trichogramma brassicae]|uniref:Uncharacterized protein n=1 Tax=Trichogramma brassicae TaxID=86971 RepID=A0A6H5IHC2_9HYME|nr:unnamed protein product [Trichogramma brassicae]
MEVFAKYELFMKSMDRKKCNWYDDEEFTSDAKDPRTRSTPSCSRLRHTYSLGAIADFFTRVERQVATGLPSTILTSTRARAYERVCTCPTTTGTITRDAAITRINRQGRLKFLSRELGYHLHQVIYYFRKYALRFSVRNITLRAQSLLATKSLKQNYTYINEDKWYTQGDLLIFSETYTHINDNYNFNNYTCGGEKIDIFVSSILLSTLSTSFSELRNYVVKCSSRKAFSTPIGVASECNKIGSVIIYNSNRHITIITTHTSSARIIQLQLFINHIILIYINQRKYTTITYYIIIFHNIFTCTTNPSNPI